VQSPLCAAVVGGEICPGGGDGCEVGRVKRSKGISTAGHQKACKHPRSRVQTIYFIQRKCINGLVH
jgi:hypothetical protein